MLCDVLNKQKRAKIQTPNINGLLVIINPIQVKIRIIRTIELIFSSGVDESSGQYNINLNDQEFRLIRFISSPKSYSCSQQVPSK